MVRMCNNSSTRNPLERKQGTWQYKYVLIIGWRFG